MTTIENSTATPETQGIPTPCGTTHLLELADRLATIAEKAAKDLVGPVGANEPGQKILTALDVVSDDYRVARARASEDAAGEIFAGSVIEAVMALHAIADATPGKAGHVEGFMRAVRFIADGLKDAVCVFEDA